MKYTWGARMMYVGFDMLIHKKQDEIPYLVYNPEIPDTFRDYPVEGYTDSSPSFNFGRKWDPIYFTPYRGHAKIRNTKIDIYFSVPKNFRKGIIYYGNEKVAEFNL